MKFTVPIELVVDGERVAEEQASMESMGPNRQDEQKRKNSVRLLGLRGRKRGAVRRRLPVERDAQGNRRMASRPENR
jgi:hypothetical protein